MSWTVSKNDTDTPLTSSKQDTEIVQDGDATIRTFVTHLGTDEIVLQVPNNILLDPQNITVVPSDPAWLNLFMDCDVPEPVTDFQNIADIDPLPPLPASPKLDPVAVIADVLPCEDIVATVNEVFKIFGPDTIFTAGEPPVPDAPARIKSHFGVCNCSEVLPEDIEEPCDTLLAPLRLQESAGYPYYIPEGTATIVCGTTVHTAFVPILRGVFTPEDCIYNREVTASIAVSNWVTPTVVATSVGPITATGSINVLVTWSATERKWFFSTGNPSAMPTAETLMLPPEINMVVSESESEGSEGTTTTTCDVNIVFPRQRVLDPVCGDTEVINLDPFILELPTPVHTVVETGAPAIALVGSCPSQVTRITWPRTEKRLSACGTDIRQLEPISLDLLQPAYSMNLVGTPTLGSMSGGCDCGPLTLTFPVEHVTVSGSCVERTSLAPVTVNIPTLCHEMTIVGTPSLFVDTENPCYKALLFPTTITKFAGGNVCTEEGSAVRIDLPVSPSFSITAVTGGIISGGGDCNGCSKVLTLSTTTTNVTCNGVTSEVGTDINLELPGVAAEVVTLGDPSITTEPDEQVLGEEIDEACLGCTTVISFPKTKVKITDCGTCEESMEAVTVTLPRVDTDTIRVYGRPYFQYGSNDFTNCYKEYRLYTPWTDYKLICNSWCPVDSNVDSARLGSDPESPDFTIKQDNLEDCNPPAADEDETPANYSPHSGDVYVITDVHWDSDKRLVTRGTTLTFNCGRLCKVTPDGTDTVFADTPVYHTSSIEYVSDVTFNSEDCTLYVTTETADITGCVLVTTEGSTDT